MTFWVAVALVVCSSAHGALPGSSFVGLAPADLLGSALPVLSGDGDLS